MEPLTAQDPLAQSADNVADNLLRLRALFPEAFVEGQVDMAVLGQLLGAAVDERDEKYGLSWHGKRQARQLALTPSTGTLRPAPANGLGDWDATGNLLIEGDNLEVLKLLQKSYAGQVKLIYIDPPYNTGKDFVYPDNFKNPLGNYLALTGQVQDGEKMSSNTEASGRFHTDWLNMMYPRLKLARNLLTKDGAIFISIDDTEVANLRLAVDEVFGPENLLGQITWQKKYGPANDATQLSATHEHIIVFAKDAAVWRPNLIPRNTDQLAAFKNPDNDPRGPWRASDLSAKTFSQSGNYPITLPSGEVVYPPASRAWIVSKTGFKALLDDNRIWFGVNNDTRPMQKKFLTEVKDGITPQTWWDREFAGDNKIARYELKALLPENVFDTPKPTKLLERIIGLCTSKEDDAPIILDFFAGSGTTGHAVMAQNAADGGNRRYILVQLPEPLDPAKKEQKTAADYCDTLGKPRTIAELTKERLRRAARKVQADNPLFGGDLGFRVYKLDTSNIAAWRPRPDDVRQSLFDYEENIKPSRTEADLLTELLLKLGLPLTTLIEQRPLPGGHLAHSLGAGTLLVCLSARIGAADYEALGQALVAWHRELAPAGDSQVLFRDSAFDSDVTKTNLAALLRQHLERVQVRSL